MRIGIVGAGMAGLACAEFLAAAGHDVVLWDKGRAPGGRMSTRRVPTSDGEAAFDFGAQYFTAREPAFRERIERWNAAGLIAPWAPAGPDAYIGVPAMHTPLEHLAHGRRVHWSSRTTHLEGRTSGWRVHTDTGSTDVDQAVVAIPAEQAAALLAAEAPDFAARAAATPSLPCWSVMLAFAAPVPVSSSYWRSEGIIGVAARNSSKAGRTGPESWVIHASPAWSTRYLEADASWISAALLAALADLVGIELPPVLSATSHRWRFARSGCEGSGSLWDARRGLGACGDWLLGPRVESAWVSGTRLAERMVISGLSAS